MTSKDHNFSGLRTKGAAADLPPHLREVEERLHREAVRSMQAVPAVVVDRVYRATVDALAGPRSEGRAMVHRARVVSSRRIPRFARLAMAACMALAFGLGAMIIARVAAPGVDRVDPFDPPNFVNQLEAMVISDDPLDDGFGGSESVFDVADVTYDEVYSELDALEIALLSEGSTLSNGG